MNFWKIEAYVIKMGKLDDYWYDFIGLDPKNLYYRGNPLGTTIEIEEAELFSSLEEAETKLEQLRQSAEPENPFNFAYDTNPENYHIKKVKTVLNLCS